MTYAKHPVFKNYEADKNGNIRHIINKKIRKPRLDRYGYPRLNINHQGKIITLMVHKFIADIFLIKPDGDDFTVDHMDNNKENNSIDNLQYLTIAENVTKSHHDFLHSKCHPVIYDGISYYSKNECLRKTGVNLHA